MFLQACFLHLNTPEIRRKLIELGYIDFGITKDDVTDGCILTSAKPVLPPVFISCPENTDLSGNPDIIDCGLDDEMFIGIAALRSDNDNYQWFTDGQYWQLSDVESWYDEDGDTPEEGCPNRDCWWKCTAGEIEARFSPMDLAEVRCDLYDAGFDVTDISDAKIQELIDEIHPLTRLGSHYWTELDRQAAAMGFPDF